MHRRYMPVLFLLLCLAPGCAGISEAALILTAKEAAYASAEWACAQIGKLRASEQASGGESNDPGSPDSSGGEEPAPLPEAPTE